jgi:hypothetical protein
MGGKFRATIALVAACGLAPIGIITTAAPASAGNLAHCSSLTVDRVSYFPNHDYIVGSCVPPNKGPGAQLRLRIECHVTGWRNKYVTLNYGMSFRVDSGCGGWGVRQVTYSPTA